MLRLNRKYLSLVFMALVLVISGCGEDEDERTGATQKITDTTAPTGSMYINTTAAPNNTNNPSVTLYITASDDYSGVSQMCISDTTACTAWETYATIKAWTLPAGDGTKTVYIWFKDVLGNANATPYSGTITLDTTAPVDGTLNANASGGSITLTWPPFVDAGSGIKDYTLVYNVGGGAAPASCSAGTAIDISARTLSGGVYSFTHSTGLTPGTTTYYRLCATDWTGNTSAGATAQATP